jgi:hypothetical protein
VMGLNPGQTQPAESDAITRAPASLPFVVSTEGVILRGCRSSSTPGCGEEAVAGPRAGRRVKAVVGTSRWRDVDGAGSEALSLTCLEISGPSGVRAPGRSALRFRGWFCLRICSDRCHARRRGLSGRGARPVG